MSVIDLVIFDLGGTTIEDRGQVLDAFLSTLKKHNLAASEAEVHTWRGASKREALRRCIEQQFGGDDPGNAKRLARAYASFIRQLKRNYDRQGISAIAGTEATFRWLKDRGIKLALMTGFDRQVTDILLQAVGWRAGVVDACVCSDDVPQGRPAPYLIFRAMEAAGVTDVRCVVVVGDTVNDLLAGTNAGVRGVVGVLSGSHGIEDLGKVQHTHIIASVAQLPALLEGDNL